MAGNAPARLEFILKRGEFMNQAAMTSHGDLSRIDVARIRMRLIEMRGELEARRSDRDLLQLKQIEAALSKMSRGGYGFCESCARPVIKARLLEAPYVRYCAICSGGRSASSPPRRATAAS